MKIDFNDAAYDIDLDPGSMSFEEMEQVEEVLVKPWGQLEEMFTGSKASMSAVRALVWIGLRRHLPDLPFEDTAGIKMSQITPEEVPDPLDSKPSDGAPSESSEGAT